MTTQAQELAQVFTRVAHVQDDERAIVSLENRIYRVHFGSATAPSHRYVLEQPYRNVGFSSALELRGYIRALESAQS